MLGSFGAGLCGREGARLDRDHNHATLCRNALRNPREKGVVLRFQSARDVLKTDRIFDQGSIKLDGDAGTKLASAAAAADQHGVGLPFLRNLCHCTCPKLGIVLRQRREVGDENLIPEKCGFGSDRGDVATENHEGNWAFTT